MTYTRQHFIRKDIKNRLPQAQKLIRQTETDRTYFMSLYKIWANNERCQENLRVNGKIQTHQLHELWLVKSQHWSIVPTPIFLFVNGVWWGSVPIQVTVNDCCHSRKFGNQVHRVFITKLQIQKKTHTEKITISATQKTTAIITNNYTICAIRSMLAVLIK